MDQKECDVYAKEYPLAWADLTRQLPDFVTYGPAKQAGLVIRYFDYHHLYIQATLNLTKARWVVSLLGDGDDVHPLRKLHHDLGSYLCRTRAVLQEFWAALREREKQLREEAEHEARHDRSNDQ